MSAFSEINLLNTVLDNNVHNSCISSSKDNSFYVAFQLLLTLLSYSLYCHECFLVRVGTPQRTQLY